MQKSQKPLVYIQQMVTKIRCIYVYNITVLLFAISRISVDTRRSTTTRVFFASLSMQLLANAAIGTTMWSTGKTMRGAKMYGEKGADWWTVFPFCGISTCSLLKSSNVQAHDVMRGQIQC